MAAFLRLRRGRTAFLHDVFMAALSFVAAQYLRLGENVFWYAEDYLVVGTLLFSAIAAVVFASLRLYRGIWRYASLNDMIGIAKAATLIVLIFLPVLFLTNRLEALPRSSMIINWFVLMALLAGPRVFYRIWKDKSLGRVLARENRRRIPVLLVGAGDAAELFLRSLERDPDARYEAVGIIDDKGSRVGHDIHGVSVRGDITDLPDVIKALRREGRSPQRLVITKRNRMDGTMVRALLDIAEGNGLTLSQLPELTDLQSSLANVGENLEVRPIAVEDLLGRPQAVLDRPAMQRLIEGQRVLVTGAGGTIGGELVRQICAFGPAHLSLLDSSEFALYTIDMEVAEKFPDQSRSTLLCDVRDAERCGAVMQREAPNIVFHAAALKHVPMVEMHPEEGVLTNVLGTRVVANACRANGVRAMVLISTDKAVNPTNIMGATKRLAESYCQALDLAADGSGTRFLTVRFGNVLGSTGSVVPLFRRQLEAGGPLTVTHPEVTRYFMTVREAVELVLQASVLGVDDFDNHGKIFVLDMGEPVRIQDLARQMVRLSGLVPDEDIKIVFTGLRPGEKLYEELLHANENLMQTAHAGILLAAPRTADPKILAKGIDDMVKAARTGEVDAVVAALSRLVPELSRTPAKPGVTTSAAR